jgi:hypothetical protein
LFTVKAGCGMSSGPGWFKSPSSAAVTTRCTPGTARARETSTPSKPRVGVRAAIADSVEHAGRIHVVDEAAEPAQEARVFVPGNPRADRPRRHGALGASHLAPGVARAVSPVSIRLARRTARTMFW